MAKAGRELRQILFGRVSLSNNINSNISDSSKSDRFNENKFKYTSNSESSYSTNSRSSTYSSSYEPTEYSRTDDDFTDYGITDGENSGSDVVIGGHRNRNHNDYQSNAHGNNRELVTIPGLSKKFEETDQELSSSGSRQDFDDDEETLFDNNDNGSVVIRRDENTRDDTTFINISDINNDINELVNDSEFGNFSPRDKSNNIVVLEPYNFGSIDAQDKSNPDVSTVKWNEFIEKNIDNFFTLNSTVDSNSFYGTEAHTQETTVNSNSASKSGSGGANSPVDEDGGTFTYLDAAKFRNTFPSELRAHFNDTAIALALSSLNYIKDEYSEGSIKSADKDTKKKKIDEFSEIIDNKRREVLDAAAKYSRDAPEYKNLMAVSDHLGMVIEEANELSNSIAKLPEL